MIAVVLAAMLAATPAPAEEPPKAEKPLGYSLFTTALDLGPDIKRIECTADMTKFKRMEVDEEAARAIVYEDADNVTRTLHLTAGILVSDCEFVEMINLKAEHKRYKSNLTTIKTYWEILIPAWDKAETEYQKTIVALQVDLREANKTTLWEEWDGPIMFILGVGSAIGLILASIEVYKEIAKSIIASQTAAATP